VANERDFYRELGLRISSARKRAELTQQDLADEVDLSRTSITNIENGNQPVSAWLLHLLAEVLGLRPSDLLPLGRGAEPTELPKDVPAATVAAIRRLGEAR
jgi:transcriptional regulator with XRE-family HTH domain